jgi:hypothetical protein
MYVYNERSLFYYRLDFIQVPYLVSNYAVEELCILVIKDFKGSVAATHRETQMRIRVFY